MAAAADAEGKSPAIHALVPSIASSRGVRTAEVEDVPSLDLPLRWMVLLQAMEHLPGGSQPLTPQAFALMTARGQNRLLAPAFEHLPLEECDELLLGEQQPLFREAFGAAVPQRLQATDLSERVGEVEAPVHLIGGWYDFMLRDLLQDFSTLQRTGRRPYLTVGPWQHMDRGVNRTSLQEGLLWFDAHLKGRREALRQKPVRVHVMGLEEWRDYESWPPPSQQVPYFLGSDGALSARPPATAAPDHYRYDPADPTPSLGGPLFFTGAGPVDNRPLEARPDVLTYTTPVLRKAVEVVGHVRAVLYVHSSVAHTDFFARLCDVHPDGRSINICDGIVRLSPGKGQEQEDSSLRIEIDMWATAHAFLAGHAIRLQLSSGAHPRFARNLGTGGDPARAVEMCVAQQTVFHDEGHPSAVVLPVVG
jgi:putative CocE/NonD family hydrolase